MWGQVECKAMRGGLGYCHARPNTSQTFSHLAGVWLPPPSPLPYFPLPSFVDSFGHFSYFYFFVGSSLVSLFFSVRFPSASRSRARSIYTPFAVPFPSAGSSPLSQCRRPLSLCLIKVQQML